MRASFLAGIVAIWLATPSMAVEPVVCFGENPDWSLGLGEAFADFAFKKQVRLDVPQKARAEGRDWPRAFTLVGRTDTAIVILDRDVCRANGRDYPISADVLTQDGSAAIVLTGCCQEIAE